MAKQDNISAITSALILLAGVSFLGLMVPRYQTNMVFLSYFSCFLGYFWFCWFPLKKSHVLGIGILCRLILFFGLPALSDDIYRFIWDGYLLKEGISPYADLPRNYLGSGTTIPGLTKELFQHLNSPEYFSIYPPFNQFIFWLSVQIDGSWLLSANIIRSLLFLADIGSFLMLRQLLSIKKMDPALAKWYFLNPLVILEFTGNLHFEGLVVFFLICGLYFLFKKQFVFSGLGFGMAIATKLLPLIYLPALFFGQKVKNGMVICGTAVLVTAISFSPMFDSDFIHGVLSSIGLYIHKFEFNASIYFLLREVGFWITGFNIIWVLGPFLSLATFFLIIFLSLYAKKQKWPIEKTLLFALTIYLLLATTVHPWYIIPLIVFGLLSGFYFPIVWSLMIFVTYFGYTKTGYELSAFWIVFEYVVVFCAIILESNKKIEAPV